MIKVEAFFGALKRSFPRINAGAPTFSLPPFRKRGERMGHPANSGFLTRRCASCFLWPTVRRGETLPVELRADQSRPANVRPWFPRLRLPPVRAYTLRRQRPAEC